MLVNITELLADGRLSEALKGLAKHPSYETDNQFQTQVIMVTGAFNRLMRDEESGLISSERRELQRNRVTHSIRSLAQRYGVTEVEAQPRQVEPVRIPTPDEVVSDTVKDKPGILFLASDPRGMGKLKLEKEFVKIRAHLDGKAKNFKLELKFEQRPDTLTKTILDERPTYVHFAGHGVGASDEFNPAGIVLEDRERNPKVVTGAALANMFRLLKKRFEIKAVLLNACESTEQAKAISTNGIYSIGMAEEIPDPAAIAFAGGFYLGLAETPDDIPFAYEMAMNSLLMEGIAQAQIPKLFLDGNEVVL